MAVEAGAPAQIRRLDETVVNRIAAGEVVQRPANALKELLENCLDAKSTQISVTVKNGGLKLLQIQDNGTGIRKADMAIVCERFTTSKLQQFGDLQEIGTYGFRGEALASISHIAHLTITTRTLGEQCAWRCSYTDGRPGGPPKPCAGNRGTQITVEELFYNTPTRRKAMRSAADEHARIAEVVMRYAVHNAAVGFSLRKADGASVDLRTPPHSTARANVGVLWGAAVARELLEVSHECSRLQFSCSGLVTNANYSGKKFTMLLFINHRLVDCLALRKALETAYAAYLPKGGHPFLYLSLSIHPRNVDVNVHPTKHEVSFLHQDAIIAAVQKCVETRLLSCAESRTFYTQSLLPSATSSASTSDPQGKTYDHSLVRTDHADQKLTKFLTPKSAKQLQSGGSVLKRKDILTSPVPGLKEVKKEDPEERPGHSPATDSPRIRLTSVLSLLEDITSSSHRGMEDILRQHTFVGVIDTRFALFQHATHLYLAKTGPLCQEMFYQMLLRDFGNHGEIAIQPPACVKALAMLALDQPDSGWKESDGSKEELSEYIVGFLSEKAEMLKEYFSLDIQNGKLRAIPYLLDDFVPELTGLPLYMLRLTTEVDWSSEKACFETFCRETALFYATKPIDIRKPSSKDSDNDAEQSQNPEKNEDSLETNEILDKVTENPGESSKSADAGPEEASERDWRWRVAELLYPALRRRLRPPQHMAADGTILQLADLHQLYKVFERC